MKIDIRKLLDFLDDKKDFHKGDVNAVIGLIGEDLNASIYRHFRNEKVDVLDDSVLPGTSNGKRLDRWIVDRDKLYQCEIKNWSATAIGGKRLKSEATDQERQEVVKYYWTRELDTNLSINSSKLHPNLITKVLLPMKKPKGYENISQIEPLLIYWMPISSDKKGVNPLSLISVKSLELPFDTNFSNLHIFSVSLYLRMLYRNGDKYIDLNLKDVERRTNILFNLGIK